MCLSLEGAIRQDPALPVSQQALGGVETNLASSECETTQVFQHKETADEAVGESESKGMEAQVAGPAGGVTAPPEPMQPESDVQQQPEQLSIEPKSAVSGEEAELRLQGSECSSTLVASVESTATQEEDFVESTDGRDGELPDAIIEKSLSVEGSEKGQQLQSPEEERGGSEEDVEAGKEHGGQFESQSENVEEADSLGW